MHYELYVDSLFFMNFIMNLYLLILVDRSIPGSAPPARLILGAAVGALGFLLPFSGEGAVVMRMAAGMVLGTVGMICITFRVRSLRMFLKLLERLAVYSFGLGGAMLFLVKRLLRAFPEAEKSLAGVLSMLGIGGLVFLLLGRFRYGVNMRNTLCRATLLQNGVQTQVNALVDSGNSLVEPFSGKPVCILDEGVLEGLGADFRKTFRAIPYHSIGKKRGILPGYLLSGLWLELDGMKLYFKDVYIAVSNGEISAPERAGAESVKMIVNPGLLAGGRKGKLQKRRNEKKNDIENSFTGKDAV